MKTETKLECPECQSTEFTLDQKVWETHHFDASANNPEWIFNSADPANISFGDDPLINCSDCGHELHGNLWEHLMKSFWGSQ